MKFGKVDHPELVDFTFPQDHPETVKVLTNSENDDFNIYVGCAKWNKADLKNFYPRGTKDELAYYSTQFNAIELNATFYRIFPPLQFEKWRDKTPSGFKFFPKLSQEISHFKRLDGVERLVDDCIFSASRLEDKLGMFFLQMHTNFAPKDFDKVVQFVTNWSKAFPLSIEFRHTDWYNDEIVANELNDLLQSNGITSMLVDTAGRRDLLHMRLTSPDVFVRYVGANHQSDYERLDDWVNRIAEWKKLGARNIYFFVHQNLEVESPLLAAYFIDKLNQEIGTTLKIPSTLSDAPTLF